jgi:DNA-directed RNA polymerase I, II, and III subunit RPABC2
MKNSDDSIVIDFVVNVHNETENSDSNKNVTDRLMTQYEYTALWACRANQLKKGMPAKVEWTGFYDPIAIAKKEIMEGVVPLLIRRKVPNPKYVPGYCYEYWDVKDMDIRDY